MINVRTPYTCFFTPPPPASSHPSQCSFESDENFDKIRFSRFSILYVYFAARFFCSPPQTPLPLFPVSISRKIKLNCSFVKTFDTIFWICDHPNTMKIAEYASPLSPPATRVEGGFLPIFRENRKKKNLNAWEDNVERNLRKFCVCVCLCLYMCFRQHSVLWKRFSKWNTRGMKEWGWEGEKY